jgi:hypothetical protein
MAEIRQYEQRLTPSQGMAIPTAPVNTMGDAFQDFGEGVNRLAWGLQQKEENDARLWVSSASEQAELDASGIFESARNSVQPGAAGFTPSVLKQWDEYSDKALANAPNERAKALYREQLQRTRGSLGQSALRFEADEGVRYRGEQLGKTIDLAAKNVYANPDDVDYRLGKVLSEIQAVEGIDPETRANLRESARSQLTWYSTLSQIDKDPEAWVMSPPKGAWNLMTVDEQAKALNYAHRQAESRVSQRLAEAALAEKAAEAEEKLLFETTSKDGDALLTEGGLTPAWVEANRDRMSKQDYRYFNQQLRGGSSGATDYTRYADLRERAGRGDDVRAEARTGLTEGWLKAGDYDRLMSQVEQSSSAGVPWFKRGNDYIARALKNTGSNYDPVAAQRHAEAMDEWSSWADSHPSATADEAQAEYKRIAADMSLLNQSDILEQMQAQKYVIRVNGVTDWDATEDALVEALQSGSIPKTEFDKRAAVIQDMRRAAEASEVTQ